MEPRVMAVGRSETHTVDKPRRESIRLLAGLGVEGNAHLGETMRLGDAAVIRITGLRNPCHQLDTIQPGLMAATLDRDENDNLVRKAGVMAVVLVEGEVRPGDRIVVELPAAPHRTLETV